MRVITLAAAVLLASGCEDVASQSSSATQPPSTRAFDASAAARWTPAAEVAPGSRQERCPLYQNPALARRGQGVVAVWLARTDSDVGRFHWAELAPAATAWTPPRPLAEGAASYFQDGAAELVGLSDGSVVAFWLWPENTSDRRLMTATLPAGAEAWTTPAPAPYELARHIRGAAGADGALHVVWSGAAGPTYARRSADGRWSAGEPVRDLADRFVDVEMTGGPSPQRVRTSGGGPMIAAAPNGAVMVAWWDNHFTLTDMGDGRRDLMWRVRAADGRWSPSRRFDAARTEEPQHSTLAADGEGFVLLFAGRENRAHAARLAYGAERWTAPRALHGSGRMFEPALAPAAGGTLLASWRAHGVSREARLVAAGSGGADLFRPLPAPPIDDSDLFGHAVAADATGRVVALFDDPEEPQGCAGLVWSATTR